MTIQGAEILGGTLVVKAGMVLFCGCKIRVNTLVVDDVTGNPIFIGCVVYTPYEPAPGERWAFADCLFMAIEPERSKEKQ